MANIVLKENDLSGGVLQPANEKACQVGGSNLNNQQARVIRPAGCALAAGQNRQAQTHLTGR